MDRRVAHPSGGARVVGWGTAALALTGAAAAVALALGLRPHHRERVGTPLAGATLVQVGHPALLVVTSLRSDGPAARAGLRVGDAIVAADGRADPSVALLAAERARRAGRPIDLRVRRGGDVVAVPLLEGRQGDDDGPPHPAGRGR